MDSHKEKALRGWAKFLNPEVLRSNLIAASIFLAAFETLCSSVIDRIRDFYTFGFDEHGPIVDDDYKTNVLSKDKNRLNASLLWLKENSAVEDADIAQIDKIRQHRNELAHELPKFLGTAEAEINFHLLAEIYTLIAKIDRWWIREVEMATDPDYAGQEIADEDIISGRMTTVHMMIKIAVGEDSAEYWEAFKEQAGM